MAWCYSTRASVATILNTHPCVFGRLWVNWRIHEFGWCIFSFPYKNSTLKYVTVLSHDGAGYLFCFSKTSKFPTKSNPSPSTLYNTNYRQPECLLKSLVMVRAAETSKLHIPGLFNTSMPRQNGRHFADDLLKCIFLNENVWNSIKISLKGPNNNTPTLVQIMAWRR